MTMTISFRCEHCGKKVEAPDSAGGKRGKCPYCKLSNYIPMPVSEEELIPLAGDEDEQPARAKDDTERALIAELAGRVDASVPLEDREDLKPEDVQHLVVNYCLDMANSRLERSQQHLAQLRKVRRAAREAVDGFLKGDVLEPALDTVPPKVLQGFLSNLREELG